MYLDGLGGLQRLLRGNAHLPLPQQLLSEVGDVTAGDGDVLDAAADDVALSLEHAGWGGERGYRGREGPGTGRGGGQEVALIICCLFVANEYTYLFS